MSQRTAALVTIALVAVVGWPVRAGDEAPPRYRLGPGQELTYRAAYRSDREGGETTYRVDWTVWVLGGDAEGGWPLAIRCDLRTKRPSPPGQEAAAEEVDTLVWRCRLFGDGRLVDATAMGTVRDPFRLFPRLPDDAEALRRGWDSDGDAMHQDRFRHRLAGTPEGPEAPLTIATTSESPIDKIYVTTHAARATFDRARGLVTRVETEDTSGYSFQGTTRGTIELDSVEDLGPERAAALAREADAYFAAVDAYDAADRRAFRDAGGCKAILAEAEAALEAARESVSEPVFRDAIAVKLGRHERWAAELVEDAADRASRIGRPAPDWEAEDLDGKIHRLADYRGKVVLLDFWYRGCGWCMYAMPQVNRLASAFRDQPVAVLGMTVDEKEEDARVVVEAMGLPYPAVRAEGLPEKFGVEGYPTLIVIDREGTIRDIHVGYSPRLFEELSEVVRGLLAEEPAE
jgi:peroxiredoxin